MSGLGELERNGGHGVGCFVPAGSYFLRAGAAGAMVAGAWTAYSEVPRVRDREITSEEAMSRVLKNAALGAGAGVVIGAAAHLAKTHPLTGVAAVLAAGAGALYLAGRNQKDVPHGEQAASGATPAESV